MLGLLLLETGRVVPTQRLIGLLWGDHPPARARSLLSTHVSRLRRSLDLDRAGPPCPYLRTSGEGYLLDVNPAAVDAHRFTDLITAAREQTDPAARSAALRAALALWRGPLLADAADDGLRDRIGPRWEEQRLSAVAARIDADLACDLHAEVVGELAGLVAAYPYHEDFVAQYMTALDGIGRRCDALAAYHRLRRLLADELGLDPGARPRSVHDAILRADADAAMRGNLGGAEGAGARTPFGPGRLAAASGNVPAGPAACLRSLRLPDRGAGPDCGAGLDCRAGLDRGAGPDCGAGREPGSPDPAPPAPPPAPTPAPPPTSPVALPAQLPGDVPGFAGRATHLARLDRLLATAAAQTPTAVVIAAVSGTAGVGKTALAVRWAHRVADRFPDGQLYVNLRGFDPGGQILEPAAAVRGFLDALGVPAERIPADLDARTALYRSLLAGKRILVVLDNARDADHARPLLPGTPTAATVVTSRNQLTGLVAADGAQPLTLDLLTSCEAHELLARRIDPGRLAAEPAAVEGIITGCSRLPLALALVAARAATHPGFGLAALATELSTAGGQVGRLDAGDVLARVRAVFSWSYATLSPAAARLFRFLGLHPGPDTSVPAAASLTAAPLTRTRRSLDEVTRAGLLTEHAPGRYGCHDLLRAYATDLTSSVDSDGERRAAITRLLDHYLHTAVDADRLLHPARDPITPGPAQPAVVPEQFADAAAALVWLTTEHPVLLAAVGSAARSGLDTHTWQLAWALDTYLVRQGHWRDLIVTSQAALRAAGRLGDPSALPSAHRLLARAHTRLGQYDDAHAHYLHALDRYHRAGDCAGQARTHHSLMTLWDRQSRPHNVLEHAHQALALYRKIGHRGGTAGAVNAIGWCLAQLGYHQQALISCREALAVFQEVADRDGEAAAWDSLGYTHHQLGDHAKAAECYRSALLLYRELGDRHREALIHCGLGDTHHAAGDPAAARAAWRQAVHILTDLDQPRADNIRAKLRGLDRPPAPPGDGHLSPVDGHLSLVDGHLSPVDGRCGQRPVGTG